jgi:hypothetical protein
MTTRRTLLAGLAGIFAAGYAPASVGSGVLMPVRRIMPAYWPRTTIAFEGLQLGARDALDSLASQYQFEVVTTLDAPIFGQRFSEIRVGPEYCTLSFKQPTADY